MLRGGPRADPGPAGDALSLCRLGNISAFSSQSGRTWPGWSGCFSRDLDQDEQQMMNV